MGRERKMLQKPNGGFEVSDGGRVWGGKAVGTQCRDGADRKG